MPVHICFHINSGQLRCLPKFNKEPYKAGKHFNFTAWGMDTFRGEIICQSYMHCRPLIIPRPEWGIPSPNLELNPIAQFILGQKNHCGFLIAWLYSQASGSETFPEQSLSDWLQGTSEAGFVTWKHRKRNIYLHLPQLPLRFPTSFVSGTAFPLNSTG